MTASFAHDENSAEALAWEGWDEFYTRLNQDDSTAIRNVPPSLEEDKHKPSFIKMAQFCLANEVDIRDYIDAVLPLVARKRRAIVPYDLLTGELKGYYLGECMVGGTEAEKMWTEQEVTLNDLLRRKVFSSAYHALSNVFQPFQAWFRVTYLEEVNERLLQLYGDAARKDIRINVNIFRMLSERRPRHLERLEIRATKLNTR